VSKTQKLLARYIKSINHITMEAIVRRSESNIVVVSTLRIDSAATIAVVGVDALTITYRSVFCVPTVSDYTRMMIANDPTLRTGFPSSGSIIWTFQGMSEILSRFYRCFIVRPPWPFTPSYLKIPPVKTDPIFNVRSKRGVSIGQIRIYYFYRISIISVIIN
jgi:hypothetical protein